MQTKSLYKEVLPIVMGDLVSSVPNYSYLFVCGAGRVLEGGVVVGEVGNEILVFALHLRLKLKDALLCPRLHLLLGET